MPQVQDRSLSWGKPNLGTYNLISYDWQKGLTTSHLHTLIDPFDFKLMIYYWVFTICILLCCASVIHTSRSKAWSGGFEYTHLVCIRYPPGFVYTTAGWHIVVIVLSHMPFVTLTLTSWSFPLKWAGKKWVLSPAEGDVSWKLAVVSWCCMSRMNYSYKKYPQ